MSRTPIIIFSLLAPLILAGCPAVIVSSAVGTGVVASDERTTGSLVEDEAIEIKAGFALHSNIGDKSNINVTSYNRRVLLTGQAPTEELRQEAVNIISPISNIRDITNLVEIGNPSSLASRSSDALITARAKTKLCSLQEEGFSCLDVKLVTEQGVLHLLGLVTRAQAAIAIKNVRNVRGVIKVVKVFEYTDE